VASPSIRSFPRVGFFLSLMRTSLSSLRPAGVHPELPCPVPPPFLCCSARRRPLLPPLSFPLRQRSHSENLPLLIPARSIVVSPQRVPLSERRVSRMQFSFFFFEPLEAAFRVRRTPLPPFPTRHPRLRNCFPVLSPRDDDAGVLCGPFRFSPTPSFITPQKNPHPQTPLTFFLGGNSE